jgi:hypothetical protein
LNEVLKEIDGHYVIVGLKVRERSYVIGGNSELKEQLRVVYELKLAN